MHDSNLGRWAQQDPAGYVDGPHLYQYVVSNPIKLIDPLGEAVSPIMPPPPPPTWKSAPDAWSHCYVGCMAGPLGDIAGVAWETWQTIDRMRGRNVDPAVRDVVNTSMGARCPTNVRGPWLCTKWCQGIDQLGLFL